MTIGAEQGHMTGIPDDAINLEYDEVHAMSLRVAEQIEAHCQVTGERFDKVLIVPRGSFYPANIITRRLQFSAVDIVSMSIGSYKPGSSVRSDRFETGQMPHPSDVDGMRILALDEVGETMRTLDFASDWCMRHGAQVVRSAVLIDKPTLHEVDMNPDWYVETTDKWVVFPWEKDEQAGRTSVVNAKFGV